MANNPATISAANFGGAPLAASATDEDAAAGAMLWAFEASNAAVVWLASPHYTVRYASAHALQWLGQGIGGQSFSNVLPAPLQAASLSAIDACLRSGEPSEAILPATPEPLVQRTKAWPPKAPTGVLVLFLRAPAQPCSADTLVQAEQQRADQFFALLAHDLRNPIGSAKMSVDGIVRARGAPERLQQKAKRASLALARADALIGRCQDVRAVEAGRPLRLTPTACTLAEMAQSAAARVNALTPDRVHIETISDASAPWDVAYMERALDDLLYTAGKYSGAQGLLKLVVAHRRIDVRVVGVAVAQSECAELQAGAPWLHSPGPGKSSVGMGLSLVRVVAEAHGGALRVSVENQQTVFSLNFPGTA